MSFSLPFLLKKGSILLIGGGKVALQKAKVLEKNRVPFKIVSKDFIPEFDSIFANKYQKSFSMEDIGACEIVIDATGDDRITEQLVAYKQEHRILLNVVDQPRYCDFYFTAQADVGNLKISVSSDGASPRMVQIVRDRIKGYLPHELEGLLMKFQQERESGKIDLKQIEAETKKAFGKVWLFCIQSNEFDQLTLGAYKRLKTLDYLYLDKFHTDASFYNQLNLASVTLRDMDVSSLEAMISLIGNDIRQGRSIGLLGPCNKEDEIIESLRESCLRFEIVK